MNLTGICGKGLALFPQKQNFYENMRPDCGGHAMFRKALKRRHYFMYWG